MRSNKTITFLLSVILTACAVMVLAESLYVRPGGGSYGVEDGSDWNNAFDGFSDVSWGAGAGSVGAGDTLYVAGGTYTQSFTIGASGDATNNQITIAKATTSAHGTETGWDSSFATNAVMQDLRVFFAGEDYITFSGVEQYGFHFISPGKGATGNTDHILNANNSTTNEYLTLEYLHIEGPGWLGCSGIRALQFINWQSHFTLRNSSVHDFNSAMIRFERHNDMLIENNSIYNCYPDALGGCANHYEHVALYYEGSNCVVRGNLFWQDYDEWTNYVGSTTPAPCSAFVLYVGGAGATWRTGVRVENNVFFNCYYPQNVDGSGAGPNWGGFQSVNNTYSGYRTFDDTYPTNCIFANHWTLWNQGDTRYAPDMGHNNLYYFDSRVSYPYGTNGIVIAQAYDLFTDMAGMDFSLASQTNLAVDAALDKSALFSTDIIGLSRPSGSAWDIGAYEFDQGDLWPSVPDSPPNRIWIGVP